MTLPNVIPSSVSGWSRRRWCKALGLLVLLLGLSTCARPIDLVDQNLADLEFRPVVSPPPTSALPNPTPVPERPDIMVNPSQLASSGQFSVNRDRLMQRLTDFSQPRFHEADREQARRYIEQVLGDRGWSVKREPFTIPRDAAPDLNGVNLIAEKAGTDPTLPPLLIGAHYDTVSDRSPGADDNASGAIALLEIGDLLAGSSDELTSSDSSNPETVPTFARTLRLVWFDLEEFGLLGSFYHVAQLDRDLYGAIILEMIGYSCDVPGCQSVPSGLAIALPDRGDFLGVVGNAEAPELLAPFTAIGAASQRDRDRAGHPPVITLAVPTKLAIAPNLLRSDHVPFWAQGIGALMVTDTANFRNPNYHRSSDTIETIDPEFLARSTQAILDVAIVHLR